MAETASIEDFTKLINDADLERLEEIIGEFNIFASLGIISKEIRHSNFLAWLMDPSESHGLSDYFLKIFLKDIAAGRKPQSDQKPTVFDIDGWSLANAEVLREWRNIDILVRSDDPKFVCVIENKIYSADHDKQLSRYMEIVEREFKGYPKMFVYLTIDGSEPEETNDQVDEYILVSYKDVGRHIERLLANKKDKTAPEIFVFIRHYLKMLRRYIMGEEEIQEICNKIYGKHRNALEFLFQYKHDLRKQIFEYLKEMINEADNLDLEDSGLRYIRFIPAEMKNVPAKADGWTKSRKIALFEFGNSENGVTLSLVVGKGEEKTRKEIFKVANADENLLLPVGSSPGPWPKIYREIFLSADDYKNMSLEKMKSVLHEKFEVFRKTKMVEISNVFKASDILVEDDMTD